MRRKGLERREHLFDRCVACVGYRLILYEDALEMDSRTVGDQAHTSMLLQFFYVPQLKLEA